MKTKEQLRDEFVSSVMNDFMFIFHSKCSNYGVLLGDIDEDLDYVKNVCRVLVKTFIDKRYVFVPGINPSSTPKVGSDNKKQEDKFVKENKFNYSSKNRRNRNFGKKET